MTTTAVGQAGHAAAARAGRSRCRRVAHRLFVVRELGIALALVLLIAVTTAVNPRFLTAQSRKDLMLGATILVVLAVGQAIVVITRNVDLSVGSVLGLSAFATGKLFLARPGAPIVAGGAGRRRRSARLCGLVNGALIAVARVPALVVTLGTLYVFRGIDYSWAQGQQINAADMPPRLQEHGHGDRAGRAGAGAVRAGRAAGGRLLPAVVPQSGGSCTRSDRTRPPPACPASRSAAGCSRRWWSAARWPGWPACCTPPGSARSTPPPAPASS